MQVTIVHVQVKTEHIDDFIQASCLNHDPSRFVLYEAYAGAADAAAHKYTEHYRHWRDCVVGWMASPRQGISCHGFCPNT